MDNNTNKKPNKVNMPKFNLAVYDYSDDVAGVVPDQ